MTLRIILEHLFITVAMASFLSIVVLLVVTVFLVARRLPVVVKAPAPPKRKVLLVRTKPSSLWEQQDQPLKEPVAAPEKARYCSSPLFAPPPLKTLSLRSCRKLNIASLSIPSPFLLSPFCDNNANSFFQSSVHPWLPSQRKSISSLSSQCQTPIGGLIASSKCIVTVQDINIHPDSDASYPN